MTGLRLAQYRIDAELGRGGMGIVYRATDTKLNRTVALKVLPAAALSSEDDRARFVREAQSAAQLHHPNIATVFGIDEAIPVDPDKEPQPGTESRLFIAMEFIDGETLSQVVAKGPLKLQDAVNIAGQVAEALKEAHAKQIVHRDIKSANVMLTSQGVAKVLDFGLAKTNQSTMLTRMGSTLGTVAYMSPEQAKGEEVDHRTDLWALGVVLYELVAGRLPFPADYEQAALYAILNEHPEPLTAIRTGLPMGLEWIVTKLLAKAKNDRYQNATDLIVDLRTVDLSTPAMSRSASVAAMPAAAGRDGSRGRRAAMTSRLRHPASLVALTLAAALLGWWLGFQRKPDTVPGTSKRITQSVPLGGVIAAMDISEDGSRIAVATETIHVLDLSRDEQRTYDAPEVFVHLAFSPDGERLLLTTSSGIKILTLSSGSIIEVAETSEGGPRAEWVDAETIVYEDIPSIYERSLTTGVVRRVIELDTLSGQYDMDFPHMLPDGKTLVATAQYRDAPDRIGFWNLKTGENRGYVDLPGQRVQYLDSGHLVFVMDADLVAMPFDLDRFAQTGPLIPLDRDVRPEGMTLSREGTLVHVGARVGIVNNARPVRPVVVRMTGASFSNESMQTRFPPAIYRSATVHPEGTMAAIVIESEPSTGAPAETDIWILDFETGSRRAFTTGGRSDFPAWSASGDSVYFIGRNEFGQRSLKVKAATGRGGEVTLGETGSTELYDLTVSPVGTQAVVATGVPGSMDAGSRYTLFDLDDPAYGAFQGSSLSHNGPGGNPRHFDYSPDGRYLAFEDQGGIYVQSMEDPDSAPYMIWENGMTLPRWSADGRMLYALNVDSGGQGVPVQLDPVFAVTAPPADFSLFWYAFGGNVFDVFPESDRFLFGLPESEADAPGGIDTEVESIDLHLIINLQSELSGVQ